MIAYKTLMVHVDLEAAHEASLAVAIKLAKQFDARVIGIAAGDFQPMYFLDGVAAQSYLEQEQAEIKLRLVRAEEQFSAHFKGLVREVGWRSKLGNPSAFIAAESRAADLIITGVGRRGDALGALQQITAGDIVMQSGRPLLLVPADAQQLDMDSVLVAWKDTREARKAVRDALPLMLNAKEVRVVEIPEGGDTRENALRRVNGIVGWLSAHGIKASALVPGEHGSAAKRLGELAREQGAQLVVAGGYGHSRVREWIFGGVTEEFMTRATHCSLVAH